LCLIVDTNVAHLVLTRADDPDFGPAHSALFDNRAPRQKIAYGGKLAEEYAKDKGVLDAVRVLARRGRAWREDDAKVDRETIAVRPECRSDDPHIIGLARISGVRLLCTKDRDLIADFKNTSVLPRPQGKVYTQNRNQHLLAEECPCKRCKRSR